MLESFLKALGHEVSGFSDPTEALLWLSDVRPQVVIADLQMPEMDGFSFVRNVRARSTYASMPIICITGTEITDEEISRGGFSAVLRKPVTLADVMAAIDEVTVSLNRPATQAAPEKDRRAAPLL